MGRLLITIGAMLLVALVLRLGLAAFLEELEETRTGRAITRLARCLHRRRAEVVVLRRPIEQVCADLRRLHDAFHRGQMPFAKYEGCRRAYEDVLAEAAEMMGAAHLLGLLPPGAELDRERRRVELLLRDHGLLPPLWAA